MAGDPSIESVCAEQEEARQLLKKIIREDPQLRARLRFWKQYADAPNGKERLWKEVVLPKLFEQMVFRRSASHNCDYFNHPLTMSAPSTELVLSPWWPGYGYNYSDPWALWNKAWDKHVPQVLIFVGMCIWTRGWWVRSFGTARSVAMIKFARNSRRYYGRHVPKIPNPAMFIRNQMVLQAVTRKMIREGKGHNIHVQQALNSVRETPPKT
jgi:hypothetical protein